MKRFIKIIAVLLVFASLFPMIVSCKKDAGTTNTTAGATENLPSVTEPPINEYPDRPEWSNIYWPMGQIFPTFPSGDGTVDAIPGNLLNDDEQVTITCLQGIVNAKEIRLGLYIDNVEKWTRAYDLKAKRAKNMDDVYKIVDKYLPEIDGVVLYSTTQKSRLNDIVNLACTVAAVNHAIPMTESDYKKWTAKGLELPVVEDLTGETFKTRYDVYQYLYDEYWEKCNQRILIVQNPGNEQLRDLGSACMLATVHLSCTTNDKKELDLMKKFMRDMEPGKSILIGWNGQERELMTAAASCGLSCVPADFFSAPSLFAQDIDVVVNPVPDMPALENKIYIAFYFSDGDNIQYCMNAMREYYDNSLKDRGKIPANWTISPALVDIAPGMMNYYYSKAKETDCFVSGPSGLGYTMPMNTWGPNVGDNFKNEDYFTSYVQMTNRYLQKSGLRAVTIWDNLSNMQRKVYTSEGNYLYGITVQNFTNGSLSIGYTKVTNNILVAQQTPGYFAKNAEGTTKLTEMGDIEAAVRYLKYDGSFPVFVSCQVSVWAFHTVSEVLELERALTQKFKRTYGDDVVEFVRADHYFNLYYQANGLPYDLSLLSCVTAEATSAKDNAALTLDGSQSTMWIAEEKGPQTIVYDLAESHKLSRVSLSLATTNSHQYERSSNISGFTVEISTDKENWTQVAEVKDNFEGWLNLPFEEINGRYVRINITNPGKSGIARIADINIYGSDS